MSMAGQAAQANHAVFHGSCGSVDEREAKSLTDRQFYILLYR
jgi:hypothetical protein